MYRIGKKQKRAILTADGNEVVVFPKGKEALAEKVCNLLNAELKVNKISSSAVLTDSLPLDNDKTWNTHDVIAKLCEATDILLHKKDYDGHGHEEILICLERGRELLQQIKR